MFPGSAHKNIERYFSGIERAFDAMVGHVQTDDDPKILETPIPGADKINLDLLRLKIYTYASVAAENQQFSPDDEPVYFLNTHGAGRRGVTFPTWADEAHPACHPAMSSCVADLSATNPARLICISRQAFGYGNRLDRPYGKYDKLGTNTKDMYGHDVGYAEGSGQLYKGRGFIQLTGFSNYQAVGKRIGVDLTYSPNKASGPRFAAVILVAFVSLHKDRLIAALTKNDLTAARRVVNGELNGLNNTIRAYKKGYALAVVKKADKPLSHPSPALHPN